MKKISIRFLASAVIVVMITSCVTGTRVTFNTNELSGADVYVAGEHIGKTPVSKKMSNGVWEDPEIILKKEGYADIRTSVEKEIKPVNLICGIFLWWPSLLWVYGPKSQQHFFMTPKDK